MRKIGGILGRSPWGPLHEHLLKVSECADLLGSLLDAFCRGQMSDVQELAEKIISIEREADGIKNEIRSHLSKSFFSAIDRSDAMTVLREQDPIADRCEDVARLLSARETRVPEGLVDPITSLASQMTKTVGRAKVVLKRLRDLAESEPSKEEIEALHAEEAGVHESEDATEESLNNMTRAIFAHESEMDPMSVWVLLRACEGVAEVADHAENAVEAVLRLAVGRL